MKKKSIELTESEIKLINYSLHLLRESRSISRLHFPKNKKEYPLPFEIEALRLKIAGD